MRDSRINYVVVGLFTIFIIGAFVTSIAMLTGRTGAMEPYFTVFTSVPGIARGTQVLFQGHPVGRVDAIEPTMREGRQRYRVDLSMPAGWQIPADSVAFLTTGLLAAVNVNIDGGEAEAILEPGGEIPSQEAADIFATLTGVAGTVDELMDNDVRPLLNSLQNQVERVGGRVGMLLSDENVQGVSRIVTNLDEASTDAVGLVAELRITREQVTEVVAKLDDMVARNEDNMDQAFLDLRYSLDSVARHIDAVGRNLEGASRNMSDFSREIRTNPALLLRGKPPPDDANGARR
jgi:phospholipid/cholesterol/gamma-HCH transport system substrate-binding protein